MWTPRRTLLMLLSSAVFLAGFWVYGHFLGGLDGLTPLPEDYWPNQPQQAWQPTLRQNELENKLRMAFGEGSEELKRTIKLEVPLRHLVLAADDFKIPKEGPRKGKVFLPLLSMAVFGKGSYPEINTVKCNKAYLTFDREITTPDQIGKSKLIAAELVGGQDSFGKWHDVEITNNRRTPERNDDLYLRTQGPVFYDEGRHSIWTDADVKLEDLQGQPKPTIITAVGMDLKLTQEAAPAKPAESRKPKAESISGVDQITLRSNVHMYLYVDPQSGFLAPEKPAAQAVKSTSPPTTNKDQVVIFTEGPFIYDVTKDSAQFQISHRRAILPSRVQVTREHQNSSQKDQLDCDQLDLQFKRKNANGEQGGKVVAEDRSLELEIESAHASQLYDVPVQLASESQGLNTSSHDLDYNARTHETVLTGESVVVMKDGNEIEAHEVRLTGMDKKESQQAKAKGPGVIHMLDRATGKRTLHARWKELLSYAKDGPYDCLTLTGDAAFEDEEHGQKLRAQRIRVWLEAADPANSGIKDQEQRLRPHHLEAYEQVRIDSAELQVVDPTDTFQVMWVDDGAGTGPIPPPATKTRADDSLGGAGKKPLSAFPSKSPSPPGLGSSQPLSGPGKPGLTGALDGASPSEREEKAKKPLRLSARIVKARVSRSDNRNDIKTVECQGAVRVLQDPTGPEDKGVDIRGDTLLLNHLADGNVLVVTGNSQNLAQVQLNKITIHGHEVRIDQAINNAKVDGAGHMLMLTTTDFEGNKLARPSELTIHWDQAMRFNGKHAEFSGGVQAEQNNARLLCQEMIVELDRSVSFKEGERNSQPAKVDRLVCDKRQTDKAVFIENYKWEKRRLIGYERIVAPEIAVDNTDGSMSAPGPGIVSLLQLRPADDDLTADGSRKGAAKTVKQKREELKLTRITYNGRMAGNNGRRIANFYDQVQVIYGPADDPDLRVDPADPPPGFMVLNCNKLAVYSRPLANGQKSQEMEANGRVRVHAREFWGNAETISYDEAKEVVVLKGTKEAPAVLYRVLSRGDKRGRVVGRTIYYYRRTGSARVDDGDEMSLPVR